MHCRFDNKKKANEHFQLPKKKEERVRQFPEFIFRVGHVVPLGMFYLKD